MSKTKNYIAVDLGASSGRVMLGSVNENQISLEECHRFPNGPIQQGDSLRWDFHALFSHIKTGIAAAFKKCDGNIESIGVDSWGVDWGLIDKNGNLLENPYHYRDSRTDGMMEKVFGLMPKYELYQHSGVQFAQLNTIYQLFAMNQMRPDILKKADKLLFIADLVTYLLCGAVFNECTIASTSQLLDVSKLQWSAQIFEKLNLPINLMSNIVNPGTVAGTLKNEIAAELGCKQVPIIAVGSHDTASAVASVPAGKNSWAFISSGTWSIMGVEIPEPIINQKTFDFGFANEVGVNKNIRLLKLLTGMWPLQECQREWELKGEKLSYTEIAKMVRTANPFAATIDLDDKEFFTPGNMVDKINSYLLKTGQKVLSDKGQIVRVILESLAFKYKSVFAELEEVLGKTISIVHIIGGGSQNDCLCQFTANALGRKVISGPVEATSLGNIMAQALAAKQLDSLSQARDIIRFSFDVKEYLPE